MSYKVYCTDKPLHLGESEPDYSRIAPFVFDTKEDAVTKAFTGIQNGLTVWKIEGPNSFYMSQAEIEAAYAAKTGMRLSTLGVAK